MKGTFSLWEPVNGIPIATGALAPGSADGDSLIKSIVELMCGYWGYGIHGFGLVEV